MYDLMDNILETIFDIRKDVDGAFEQYLSKYSHNKTDIFETNDGNLVIQIEAPGVLKESVKVSLNERTLRVTFSRNRKKEGVTKTFLHEIPEKISYDRTFNIPSVYDLEKISGNSDIPGYFQIVIPRLLKKDLEKNITDLFK